jgi:hypothetical protein
MGDQEGPEKVMGGTASAVPPIFHFEPKLSGS